MDGLYAMNRVRKCRCAVFLVCETEGKIVGLIRGNCDGSRAMSHQLSVHPNCQRRGIRRRLAEEILLRFKEMGVLQPPRRSLKRVWVFGKKAGFRRTEAFFVGNS